MAHPQHRLPQARGRPAGSIQRVASLTNTMHRSSVYGLGFSSSWSWSLLLLPLLPASAVPTSVTALLPAASSLLRMKKPVLEVDAVLREAIVRASGRILVGERESCDGIRNGFKKALVWH